MIIDLIIVYHMTLLDAVCQAEPNPVNYRQTKMLV